MKKILCLALAVLTLVSLIACGQQKTTVEEPQNTVATQETAADGIQKTGLWKDALYTKDASFGTGAKEVKVTVEADGKSIVFTLHTDKDNLGDALLEAKVVEGDDSAYGLYIKKVNGILADYDADKSFWSFNQNGEMMMTGVSGTEIKGGESFELVYTKG